MKRADAADPLRRPALHVPGRPYFGGCDWWVAAGILVVVAAGVVLAWLAGV